MCRCFPNLPSPYSTRCYWQTPLATRLRRRQGRWYVHKNKCADFYLTRFLKCACRTFQAHIQKGTTGTARKMRVSGYRSARNRMVYRTASRPAKKRPSSLSPQKSFGSYKVYGRVLETEGTRKAPAVTTLALHKYN